jgi:hypothetical protein
MLAVDQVPAAIRGTPPKWALDDTVVYAWGPFAVERDGAGGPRIQDLGMMLAPARPGTMPEGWVEYSTDDRVHVLKLVRPSVVKGNALVLRTPEGAVVLRPLGEADRGWIGVPADEPNLLAYVRRQWDW